jgi:sulfonate transport system substrate-binding protein
MLLYRPRRPGLDKTTQDKHHGVFKMSKLIALLLLTAATLAVVACGGDDDEGTPGTGSTQAADGTSAADEEVTLRLGYFPNITHSQPIVGLHRGTYAEVLGANVKLETVTFNAGPSAIEALFAGAIDATYIGPNPAINGYAQSDGEALRIVAGATSGGALLIVRPEAGINEPGDLDGKRIASPQLGNTQDVALRKYLLDIGLGAKESGGNVDVLPTANPDTLNLFKQGKVDGAWVPEPWATRLIQEAGGEVFLDERELWPQGAFVTTHLIVSTDFLDEHPSTVEKLIQAHVETTEWINENPADARQLVNEGIEEVTGAALPAVVIDTAWENIEVTYDPVSSSLFGSAASAKELGFIDEVPDANIYSLDPLNQVLTAKGIATVRVEGGG